MRNTMMMIIMVLVYAIGSDMDYADAQLMHEGGHRPMEKVSCTDPRGGCVAETSQKLAMNSR